MPLALPTETRRDICVQRSSVPAFQGTRGRGAGVPRGPGSAPVGSLLLSIV